MVSLIVAAATTTFTFVEAIYFSTIPYPDPERVIEVGQRDTRPTCHASCVWAATPGQFTEWADQLRGRAKLAALEVVEPTLSTPHRTELSEGAAVSGDLFAIFGLRSTLGRTLDAQDDNLAAADVIVLSHDFWMTRFDGDSGVLNSTLTLDGRSFRIVGVLSSASIVGRPVYDADDVTAPFYIALTPYAARSSPRVRVSTVVGRLARGVSPSGLQAAIQTLLLHSDITDPRTNATLGGASWKATVVPVRVAISREYAPSFTLVFTTVPIVSVVALINLFGLFVARWTAKARDADVCRVLGARRIHVLRQFGTEAVVLGTLGSAIGVVVANWAVGIWRYLPERILPYWTTLSLDRSALFFGVCVSIATVGCLGVVPALAASSERRSVSLGAMGIAATPERNALRARHLAVAAQTALSLVLLTAAGLVVKTFVDAANRDVGVSRTGVIRGVLFRGIEDTASAERRVEFARALEERLRRVAGVEAVGIDGGSPRPPLEGMTRQGDAQMMAAGVAPGSAASVNADFFRATGMKIVHGRAFEAVDGPEAQPVGIIDEPTAQHLFPGGDAIGKRIKFGQPTSSEPWITIVGVVGGVRNLLTGAAPYRPVMFRPIEQVPPISRLSFAVRTHGPTTPMIGAVAEALHAFTPSAPVAGLTSVEDRENQLLAPLRVDALVIGILAGFCILIAATGIYGVTAFGVAQRRREFAVRLALGAPRANVVALVLRRTASIVGAAIVCGAIGSVGAAKLLRSILFGTSPTDWRIFGGAALGLAVVALTATLLPTLRATHVDPASVLRSE